jgi:hypothetical protein
VGNFIIGLLVGIVIVVFLLYSCAKAIIPG